MSETRDRFVARWMAALLLLWALLLHGRFLFCAGALWRDEANSASQAALSTWRSVWDSLAYDSFPALYPAVVRAVLPKHAEPDDWTLRIFGVATGLGLLLSLWAACRALGSPWPLVAFALLAIDPVVISEGDSLRPYGLGLLCLAWSYCAFGKLSLETSPVWSAIAAASSILAVQTSYTGAIFVATFTLCALLVRMLHGKPGKMWILLLPGALAALSLAPYAGRLQKAAEWMSLVHSAPNWAEYLSRYIKLYSAAPPVAWLLMLLLGFYSIRRISTSGGDDSASRRHLVEYGILTALVGTGAQIVFLHLTGVPPFPRYFLPVLLLGAFAIELLTVGVAPAIRAIAVLAVLLITFWPSLVRTGMCHSNVDRVAAVLSKNARARDLIVVSPWFLHPSFQRYYRGPAPWTTVPPLAAGSLTRYDLVREAMLDSGREASLHARIQTTLTAGGTIWLISQTYPSPLEEKTLPQLPRLSLRLSGDDYVRFRSYWERAIIFRLYSGCRPAEYPLPAGRPAWEEERLVLTNWNATGSEGHGQGEKHR